MDANASASRLSIEHVAQIDSTNTELLRRARLVPAGSDATAVWLVAGLQTAGRGRRQRTWVSTPGDSLTASLGYELPEPRHLGALPLAAGVAVAQTLAAFGVQVRLKWPNDLYIDAVKAGGILCEARARGQLTRIVVGCGLNLLRPDPQADLGQPAAGLFDHSRLPDRDRLIAAIGHALLAACDQLHADGFECFRQRWNDRDLLHSREILIHDYAGATCGIARGIDDDGALLVERVDCPGRLQRILAEEVSVRPLSGPGSE